MDEDFKANEESQEYLQIDAQQSLRKILVEYNKKGLSLLAPNLEDAKSYYFLKNIIYRWIK